VAASLWLSMVTNLNFTAEMVSSKGPLSYVSGIQITFEAANAEAGIRTMGSDSATVLPIGSDRRGEMNRFLGRGRECSKQIR
jgi:hypothetical protein